MSKKTKKAMSMLLVVALIAVIAIGGMLAYLTDRDSEANVFTVGDVKIDLNEDFQQGITLTPGVDIEKKATITNTGKNDAWVWGTVAIPTALDDTSNASKNIVHFNYEGDYTEWTWTDASGNWMVKTEKINGVDYNVYSVLNKNVLKAGQETRDFINNVYMDTHIDIDPDGNWAWVENGNVTKLAWNSNTNGNPVVYVSAYAMQVEEFVDVYAAYNAYDAQWKDKGTEYGTPAKVVTVGSLTDLDAALKAANSEPVVIDAEGANLGDFYYDAKFTDGSVIKNAKFTYFYGGNVEGTVTFDNCEFVSDHSYSANFDSGNGNIIFNNCLFDGWSSFGTAITGVEMNNCTFQKTYNYGILRFYQDAQLNNCTFKDSFEGVDTNVTGTNVCFNGCTGIDGKIFNNGSVVGNWFVNGTDISSTITSW